MSESQALLTEAEKLARVADDVSAHYATELARVLRDLERELRRLVLAAQDGKQGALSRAVRAARIRKQIQTALRTAGYERLAETASASSLDRLVVQLGTLRNAAQLAQFTTADMTRILALKELVKLDLLGQGQSIAHAIWRTVAQGLFSQRPVNDLLDDLAEALDLELSEARTLYDTTVNIFARQVEAMKATEGDVYAYMGPADKKLRPFCHAHIGKVYTRPEIEAMDNGQLPNVYLTGGGYNCRHSWIALSKASELRDLQGTDQRVPEVEQQLASVGDRKAA